MPDLCFSHAEILRNSIPTAVGISDSEEFPGAFLARGPGGIFFEAGKGVLSVLRGMHTTGCIRRLIS